MENVMKYHDYIEERNAGHIYRSSFFDFAGKSLKQTIGEPRQIRRAKALKSVLEEMDLVVQPYELLGGTIAGIYPEMAQKSFEEYKEEGRKRVLEYVENRSETNKTTERQALYSRILYHGRIKFEMMQDIIDELTVEMGETYQVTRSEVGFLMEKLFTWDFGENGRYVGELPWEASNHNDYNPKKFLNRGLGSIREEVIDKSKNCTDDKKEFYTAALIAVDAVIDFIARYAKAYQESAQCETDEVRRSELMRIANAMQKVSTEKPETFFEALQLLWLIYLISHIQAAAGSCGAYALFDRYMYPFYKADLEAGRITEDEAQKLICTLYLKNNEPKMRPVISVTIGGQMADGTAVANDITRMCMRAVQILHQPFPNLGLRVCDATPKWVLEMAVETIKMATGNPQLINDNTWIPNFERHGYSREDACEYYNMGCVEMMIMGKVARWCNMVTVNFPDLLWRVFENDRRIATVGDYNYNDGLDAKIFTGSNGLSNFPMIPTEPIATKPISELVTYQDFLDAYKAQICHSLSKCKEQSDLMDSIHDKYWCDPFASLFTDGCLEKGVDIYQGGAKYDALKVISGMGLGTAIDSLMAIKKFVYEDKIISLADMYRMMCENYANDEFMRIALQNKPETYGNNTSEADATAREVFSWFADAVDELNQQGIRGVAVTSVFSYVGQVTLGETIGATPNGRLSGAIISDSIGPSQGKDTCGPVCMLNSVAALDWRGITGACSVNLKLSPAVAKGSIGTQNIVSLIKGYFANGGTQLQVNYVDSATLRAAQLEPEKYNNLIVRIAGYCEYFNNLDRKLQNEIIARSEHGI